MTTDDANVGTVPGLSNVIARFPVCLLASIALCAVANLRVANLLVLDQAIEQRVILGLIAMFLAGGVGHLFAEGRHGNRAQNLTLAVGLAGLAGIAFLLQPMIFTEPLFLLPGLVLLLMVAGFSGPPSQQPAFWLFNARLAIAIFAAIGVGLLFGAGLWAVIRSYGYLFPPGLDHRWEEHVWLTGITLVGPVCGLSLIQSSLDEGIDPVGDRSLFGRAVSILATWILVPIVVVYAVLLHAYAAKVAWQRALPDGEIGWMVFYYLLAGTAAWLIVQPWAERGNRLLRWFAAAWLKLTIIPVVLLGAAVIQRIWAYGILPERYGLALGALWMLAFAAYAASVRGRPDPRVAVAGLGMALVVCAFGPWGARGLSVRDQTDRLIAIFEAGGMVSDGRLVEESSTDWSPQARRSALSIVAFLDEVDALERLRPLLPAGTEEAPIRDRLASALGQGGQQAESRSVIFKAFAPGDISIPPAMNLVGPLSSAARGIDPSKGTIRTEDDRLVITYQDRVWIVSLGRTLEGVSGGSVAGGEPVALRVPGDNEATILVTEFSGRVGGRPSVDSAVVWLIVPDRRK